MINGKYMFSIRQLESMTQRNPFVSYISIPIFIFKIEASHKVGDYISVLFEFSNLLNIFYLLFEFVHNDFY